MTARAPRVPAAVRVASYTRVRRKRRAGVSGLGGGFIEECHALIQALVNQPFAMCYGCSLGAFQFGEKSLVEGQRQPSGGAAIRGGDMAAAGPGRRDAGVFHNVSGDDVVTVGALHRGHEINLYV